MRNHNKLILHEQTGGWRALHSLTLRSSYAHQHAASMETRFAGIKAPLNSIGKVKETIDVKDVKEAENQSNPKS
jgi:hypothetical protein